MRASPWIAAADEAGLAMTRVPEVRLGALPAFGATRALPILADG